MRSTLRQLLFASLILLAPLASACDDDDGDLRPKGDAGADAGKDSGVPDAGAGPASSLPRPGLARPPRSGLPPELRPPR